MGKPERLHEGVTARAKGRREVALLSTRTPLSTTGTGQ